MKMYEEAITYARTGGFTNIEAMACQLSAEFYLTQEITTVALDLFRRAICLFQKWGAHAKVDKLKGRLKSLKLEDDDVIPAKPIEYLPRYVVTTMQVCHW
jgi:hypothetical protein